jgi:hypothetical protein
VQEGAVDRNERRSAGDRDRFLQRMQAYDAGMARAIQGDYANAMARYNRDHAAAERGLERQRSDRQRADDILRREAGVKRQQGNEDRRFAEMQRVNDENIALRKATQQATAANNSARTAAYVQSATGGGAGKSGKKKKSMRVAAEEGWPEAKQDVDGKYYVTIETDDDEISKWAQDALGDAEFRASPRFARFARLVPDTRLKSSRNDKPPAPTANERLELARAYHGYNLHKKNTANKATSGVTFPSWGLPGLPWANRVPGWTMENDIARAEQEARMQQYIQDLLDGKVEIKDESDPLGYFQYLKRE